MSRGSAERKLQTKGVQWMNMTMPAVLVIAVINELPQTSWGPEFSEELRERERKANMIRMTLMKGMGLYPGAADLIVLWNDGRELQVRFLETKDRTPQSVNQEKFQKRLEAIGGVYRIWRSLPELEDICRSWGLVPAMTAPKGTLPVTKKDLLCDILHQFNIENKNQHS